MQLDRIITEFGFWVDKYHIRITDWRKERYFRVETEIQRCNGIVYTTIGCPTSSELSNLLLEFGRFEDPKSCKIDDSNLKQALKMYVSKHELELLNKSNMAQVEENEREKLRQQIEQEIAISRGGSID